MIGLETHVQLNTKTKLFCGCENPIHYTKRTGKEPEPNTLTCPACLGMPGSKPTFNKKVYEMALKVATALNCEINQEYFFSRKTYFYPDMAKNFQITQYERPIAENGHITITTENNEKKKIRIRRIHIEEDPAKLMHEKSYSLVDYNRSGIPLLEIVTEPDLSSPKEARIYLQKLALILEYLNVYESNSTASIKSDGNISIIGSERVEIKNITGAKELEKALSYEHIRQKNILKRNGEIKMETRAWMPEANITKPMRTKETEEDYGYIFEPDLPYYKTKKHETDQIKQSLPELPDQKKQRFIKQYKITEKLAESLTSDKDLSELFEEATKTISIKNSSSWIGIVLKKILNYNNLTLAQANIKKEWILETIKAYENKEYTDLNTELILRDIIALKKSPKEIIKIKNYSKIDNSNIKDIIQKILKNNEKALNDYKSGNEKAIHFLVGQIMKETKGSIDPKTAKQELLKELKNI